MNPGFEADAAVRELEELHEWVKRQRRNLLRIRELGQKAEAPGALEEDERHLAGPPARDVKITREND